MHWFRERFCEIRQFGRTAGGRPLFCVQVGEGKRKSMLTACHHANEWLTGLCLWYAMEEYCRKIACGDFEASCSFAENTVLAVPWVNPDGAALLLGLGHCSEWEKCASIAAHFPLIPFPEGWKANLQGVDLNLNYPANWEGIRRRKNVYCAAPRDYAGPYPFSEEESCALKDLTETFSPHVTAALHTQGEEIYANFGNLQPKGTKQLANALSDALGYPVIRTPAQSDAGGYKDWFMQEFDRPAATVELGLGENPLPLALLPQLMEKTKRILHVLLTQNACVEQKAMV